MTRYQRLSHAVQHTVGFEREEVVQPILETLDGIRQLPNYRLVRIEEPDPNALMTVRCAWCRWKFSCRVRDASKAFVTHRELKHPETLYGGELGSSPVVETG